MLFFLQYFQLNICTYVPPSYVPWYDHPNNIWRKAQSKKLILHFSPHLPVISPFYVPNTFPSILFFEYSLSVLLPFEFKNPCLLKVTWESIKQIPIKQKRFISRARINDISLNDLNVYTRKIILCKQTFGQWYNCINTLTMAAVGYSYISLLRTIIPWRNKLFATVQRSYLSTTLIARLIIKWLWRNK